MVDLPPAARLGSNSQNLPRRLLGGRFELVAEIAAGGMGVVWKGRDLRDGGWVAVKLLTKARDATPRQRRRFEREAQALAAVDHPGVVRVRAAGEEKGQPYLVLDYHEHGTLQDAIDRSVFSPRDAAALGVQLAAAIAAVHGVGVLHRDLKPENVLSGASGPLLADFGLAKDLSRVGLTQQLTKSGAFLGTPGYWSPEQAAGSLDRISSATDVYGLGAILYAALTGSPPIQGSGLLEIAAATASEVPLSPRSLRPEVPARLDRIVMRCLEKEPSERWESAEALERALAEFLDPTPVQSRRGIGFAAAVLALGCAGGAFAALSGESPAEGRPTPQAAASPVTTRSRAVADALPSPASNPEAPASGVTWPWAQGPVRSHLSVAVQERGETKSRRDLWLRLVPAVDGHVDVALERVSLRRGALELDSDSAVGALSGARGVQFRFAVNAYRLSQPRRFGVSLFALSDAVDLVPELEPGEFLRTLVSAIGFAPGDEPLKLHRISSGGTATFLTTLGPAQRDGATLLRWEKQPFPNLKLRGEARLMKGLLRSSHSVERSGDGFQTRRSVEFKVLGPARSLAPIVPRAEPPFRPRWVFEAESAAMLKTGGRQVGGDWSSAGMRDKQGKPIEYGIWIFGPYTREVAPGPRHARFRFRVDRWKATLGRVLTFDVSDGGKVLATRIVWPGELQAGSYQSVDLAFQARRGQRLEFRTWCSSENEVRIDKVLVR